VSFGNAVQGIAANVLHDLGVADFCRGYLGYNARMMGDSYDPQAISQAVGRVRRAMPRNSDVMLVCEALEMFLATPRNVTGETLHTECPVCAARREAGAKRVAKHRSKGKL
jgi:hypothetical protein